MANLSQLPIGSTMGAAAGQDRAAGRDPRQDQPRSPGVPGGEGCPGAPGFNAALSVAIADDLGGFESLEADWRALFAASATDNYFASYDWCKCWWDRFAGPAGSQPMVIGVRHGVRRGGRLVALLALSVRRTGPLRLAEAMGHETGQYSDLLIEPGRASDEDIFTALWDGIVAAGIDRIQFANVRQDSALSRFLAPRRTIRTEPTYSCCLDTAGYENFAAYMNSRSASLRKNVRRRRRKLEELGTVTYESVTDPAVLDQTIPILVAKKREWLAERGLYGRFLSQPQIAAWMADVASAALRTGHLHLSLLRVGDRIASAQLGFICGATMTGYFTSFDLDYSAYAVGRMQVHGFIEQLFDRRLKIDLMPPDDDYKTEWTELGVAACAYTVPITRLGATTSLVFNVRNRAAVKKIYLGLPDRLRATIAAAVLPRAS